MRTCGPAPTRSRGSRGVGYDFALSITVADRADGSVARTAVPMSGGGRAHTLAFAAAEGRVRGGSSSGGVCGCQDSPVGSGLAQL